MNGPLSKHKDIAIIHLKEEQITWTYATLATQGNAKLSRSYSQKLPKNIKGGGDAFI